MIPQKNVPMRGSKRKMRCWTERTTHVLPEQRQLWVVFLEAEGGDVTQMETCAWIEEKDNLVEREFAEYIEDGYEELERDWMGCGGNGNSRRA